MACGGSCCGSNNAGPGPSTVQQKGVDGRMKTEESATAIATPSGAVNDIANRDRFVPGTCKSSVTGERHQASMKEGEALNNSEVGSAGTTAHGHCETSCCSAPAPSPAFPIQPDDCCSSRMPLEKAVETEPLTVEGTSSCCFGSQTTEPCEVQVVPGHKGCSSKPTLLETSSTNENSCCTQTQGATGCSEQTRTTSEALCKDECCAGEEAESEDDCIEDCCGQGDTSVERPDCCAGSEFPSDCCTKDKKDAVVGTIEVSRSASDNIDLERGLTNKEHVVLSISGMTCTGCETKLKRTLGTLSYVSNLKTSLVLARAELDIVQGAATADDVVKHLQRTTEFRCERVSNQGTSLDLTCSVDAKALVKGDWPDGVLEVTHVEKDLIRVAFDAKLIGARKLLDQDWARPLRLAPPQPDPTLGAGSRHVRRMGLMTLLSAILTIPVLVMAWAPLPEREIAYGSASLALATIVQIVIAGPFYPKAVKALVFSKVIEMDLLIVLSTSAAYIFSVVSFGYLVSGHPLSTGEFFETSTLLVTLIMVGRWIASLARQKAAESVSIRALQAQTAILVEADDKETEIDARLLEYGDIFKVAPDSRIPTDGTVISGTSEVDESMLTGESLPVEKHTGSTVIAGSINGMSMLIIRLTRLPGDNTITTIACMVDEAKLSKPRIQDIADKVASYFVPVVIALTIITFTIWVSIGVAVRHQSGSQATIEAITYAITVLIVSCPCAIGLAVPMVIVVASGVAARRGVIFKSSASIEVAYKTTDLVFDKTGTLTMGKLTVATEAYLDEDSKLSKAIMLGLVKGIKHPVSLAVEAYLTAQGIMGVTMRDTKAVVGKGVEGRLDGKILRAGNSTWLNASSHPAVQSMLSQGLTTFCFEINNVLVAVLGLRDTLRPDAISTVNSLQKAGINVHILSGDDNGAVQAIAAQLNIANDTIRSRCSPGDKQAYIQDLLVAPSRSQHGKARKPVVMFVGDGTNDAVALAQATIGVHVSSGTDIAQSAADVVLVRSDLSCVLTLIAVSSKAMRRVAFNFGWSFTYNLFAVLLGGGAFVNARIPPEYAGLGELVSVLPVILAATLLRWSRI